MKDLSLTSEAAQSRLLLAAGMSLAGYGFVSLIATSFAHDQIRREPWFYVPAIWLNAYLLFTMISGIKPLPKRVWQTTGLVLHVVSVPSMFLSYFLLGLIIFPIVAWRWLSFYRACYPDQRSWLSRELL